MDEGRTGDGWQSMIYKYGGLGVSELKRMQTGLAMENEALRKFIEKSAEPCVRNQFRILFSGP